VTSSSLTSEPRFAEHSENQTRPRSPSVEGEGEALQCTVNPSLDDALSRLCGPPEGWNDGTAQHIRQRQFNQIADLLKTFRENWSKHPRLYTILRNIGRLDILDHLIRDKIADFDAPFTKQGLIDLRGEFLLNPELLIAFLEHQKYISTDEHAMEKHRKHLNLDEPASEYFVHGAHLGQGRRTYVSYLVVGPYLR
jgi:hypothetical protein